MLDTLAELAKRDDEATADERRHVAREVLSRIAERRQAAGRPPLFEERSLAALDKQLQQWVAPPEGEELLALVERFESDGRAEDARHLAELRDQLGRSTVAADNDLGRRLDVHYRNANVRVALSSQLINRLLPEQKTGGRPRERHDPGNAGSRPQHDLDRVGRAFAARIRGRGKWRSMPAATFDSQTSSTYGPVTFMNQGAAQFCVRKRIVVDTAGIHAEPAAAAVDSNTAVAGMRTDYDNIPLVRSIVRNYAMSQRQQKEGQANQETEEKIRAGRLLARRFAGRAAAGASRAEFPRSSFGPARKAGFESGRGDVGNDRHASDGPQPIGGRRSTGGLHAAARRPGRKRGEHAVARIGGEQFARSSRSCRPHVYASGIAPPFERKTEPRRQAAAAGFAGRRRSDVCQRTSRCGFAARRGESSWC